MFEDTKRKEVCSFRAASDGKTRCMPPVARFISAFSDAACHVPVYLAQNYLCEAEPLVSSHSGCTSTPEARLSKPVTPSLVYSRNGASCTGQPPPSGYQAFTTKVDIAPAEFAEGSPRTL